MLVPATFIGKTVRPTRLNGSFAVSPSASKTLLGTRSHFVEPVTPAFGGPMGGDNHLFLINLQGSRPWRPESQKRVSGNPGAIHCAGFCQAHVVFGHGNCARFAQVSSGIQQTCRSTATRSFARAPSSRRPAQATTLRANRWIRSGHRLPSWQREIGWTRSL